MSTDPRKLGGGISGDLSDPHAHGSVVVDTRNAVLGPDPVDGWYRRMTGSALATYQTTGTGAHPATVPRAADKEERDDGIR
jgi:hypothetical protein